MTEKSGLIERGLNGKGMLYIERRGFIEREGLMEMGCNGGEGLNGESI